MVRLAFVPTSVAVTVAPATTAPVASVTMPESDPFSDCANATGNTSESAARIVTPQTRRLNPVSFERNGVIFSSPKFPRDGRVGLELLHTLRTMCCRSAPGEEQLSCNLWDELR